MKRLISSIVALVVMLSLVAVPAALAQEEGVTGVTGTLPAASLEITAPTNITLDTLYGTGDAIGSSTTNGSVACYGGPSLGYTLSIKSDNANGKMMSGANELDAALLVTATLANGTGAEVIPTAYPDNEAVNTTGGDMGSTTESTETNVTNDITLSVSQARQLTGVAGDYSINLTFTAIVKT